MAELFASGRVVDVILGLVVLEAVALAAYRATTGRGPVLADLAGNLVAGACLMLALRGALVRAWWAWIALCLTAALVAHAFDLARRWRQ